MTTICPVCENPASATVKVSIGDGWDKFGKPPHSLLCKYQMIHAARDRLDDVVAYLHSEDDLR